MTPITTPYPFFFDTDGSPLDGGYLYFGTANQNPETSPVTVYWDAAGLIPAAQPIRTLNGYPVRSGNIAQVYVSAAYSLTVRNKRREMVIYLPVYSREQLPIEQAFNVRTDTPVPHVGLGIAAVPESLFVQRTNTVRDGTAIQSAAQFQRIYDANHPTALTKNVTVSSVVGVDGGTPVTVGLAWGLSAEMYIRPGATVTGDVTASSAVIQKFSPNANAIAFHAQVRDYNTYALDGSNVTPNVGIEINMPVTGLDSSTANHGYGNRFTAQFYARTNNDTGQGASGVTGETGTGVYITHTELTSGVDTVGYYRFGLGICDNVQFGGPNAMKAAQRLITSGEYGIWQSGNKTIAEALFDGNSANGILLNGNYGTFGGGQWSGSALRIKEGQFIALEITGALKFRYNATLNYIEFFNGATRRGYIDMAGADHAL